jgi:ABC-type dipeptide/oligopeptide/nickel transport system permease subunit
MLQESRLHLASAPWLMFAPGLAITLAVLACNLVAEGLQHLGERPPRELL